MKANEIKDSIFSSMVKSTERVSTPEFSGVPHVWVRLLGVKDIVEFSEIFGDEDGDVREDEWVAHVVCLCACDESGERVFSKEDKEKIKGLPMGVVQRVFSAAAKINGFGVDRNELSGN